MPDDTTTTPPPVASPAAPAPSTQPAMQPWQQPIDPQALALTRAIALQESTTTQHQSPDYNAKGASGEFGAYQWMPGEFQADAKQYGLDPTDTSPENQDKVAYSFVKSQKDAGMQPAQIASTWNSGSPDNWQNHSGVNSAGVSYDTPAYVKGVQAHYDQIYSQMNPGAQTPAADGTQASPSDGTQAPAPQGILQTAPAGAPITQGDIPGLSDLEGKNAPDMSQVPGQIASDFKNAYDTITNPTDAEKSDPFSVAEAVTTAAASVFTRPLSPVLSPIINKMSDAIVSNPSIVEGLNAVNSLIDAHPETAKTVGSLFNTVMNATGLIAGGAEAANAPKPVEFQGPTSMAIDIPKGPPPGPLPSVNSVVNGDAALQTGVEIPQGAPKNAVIDEPKAPAPETQAYLDRLDSIAQAVYPKLTPTELKQLTLKEPDAYPVIGQMRNSGVDLTMDPRTRPVLESVSNDMPVNADGEHDLVVSPKQSIAQNQAALSQGISRLHQGTDVALAQPLVRANTSFTDAQYSAYMKANFLDPIAAESGVDSPDYKAAQDMVSTGRDTLPTNDAHGAYQMRQDLNAAARAKYPKAFKTSAGSMGANLDPMVPARIRALQEFGRVTNSFVEDLLPENSPYRARLQSESNLIRARSELRARSSSMIGESTIHAFMRNNPGIKKGLQMVPGISTLVAGADVVGHMMGSTPSTQ